VMKKKANIGDAADVLDIYTPPCVVRISDLNRGNGQQLLACAPGSGDAGDCLGSGNGPRGDCVTSGNGVT
jgi:hypothetical protein